MYECKLGVWGVFAIQLDQKSKIKSERGSERAGRERQRIKVLFVV